LNLFRSRLDQVFTTSLGADGMVELTDLVPLVNEGLGTDEMFGSNEARKAAERMHERNEIMFSEGTVYKV
jgi:DNA replication licensing factor MCM3